MWYGTRPLGEIHVQLMGEVQLEVLRSLPAERFGLNAEFTSAAFCTRRPSRSLWEGAGHYEPLRHHAEVHVKPFAPRQRMQFAADCREEVLTRTGSALCRPIWKKTAP